MTKHKQQNNGANVRKDAGGRYLLTDVAEALKVPHYTAFQAAKALLQHCPSLADEFSEVTAHPSRGGHWVTSYRMTAAGFFAFTGWIELRRASRLMFGVLVPAEQKQREISRKAAAKEIRQVRPQLLNSPQKAAQAGAKKAQPVAPAKDEKPTAKTVEAPEVAAKRKPVSGARSN